MVEVVYVGLVVEEGENTKAVKVIQGQVSLPRVDKSQQTAPSEDVEGLRLCANVANLCPRPQQKTAYEIMPSLVGSEMCIRDSPSSTLLLRRPLGH